MLLFVKVKKARALSCTYLHLSCEKQARILRRLVFGKFVRVYK